MPTVNNYTLRQPALSCLLVRDATFTHRGVVHDAEARWVVICSRPREDFTKRQVDSIQNRFLGTGSGWTKFIVVLNLFAEQHPEDTPSAYEDLALEKLIRESERTHRPVSEIQLDESALLIDGATRHSSDAWQIIREVFSQREYLDLRDRIATLSEQAQSPFPVIRALGFASFTAETYLVWWKSQKAVCKCFRPGYEHHYETELAGLKVASKLGVGPEVLEIGPTWILMEYLEGFRPLRPEWYKMYDISAVRSAFRSLHALHDYGYAHFDFNPLNVMHDRTGDVRLIDYENLFPMKGSSSFFDQPVFSGARFFETGDVKHSVRDENRICRYRTSGPMATFRTNWYPNVGLSPQDLLSSPRMTLAKRSFYFISKRVVGRMVR